MLSLHEIEELEYQDGPKLWDAGEGVCCAAYQLGACSHTEDASQWEDEDDMTDAELAEFRTAELAPLARRLDEVDEPF